MNKGIQDVYDDIFNNNRINESYLPSSFYLIGLSQIKALTSALMNFRRSRNLMKFDIQVIP